jgi:adenylate kinase
MNLILLGAPGAGKGTVAKVLVERNNVVQISTGDMLRKAITDGTPAGKKAKSFIDEGKLVPDEAILEMMEDRLKQPDCAKGVILDGFPRTIPQAEGLKALLKRIGMKIDAAVDIDVPEKTIVERLSTRRTCSNPACQEIYNTVTKPTKVEGKCDKCGADAVQRSDETPEAIKMRLETYYEKTKPLINFYEKEGLLISLDGNSGTENVYRELMKKVNG